MKPAEIKVCPSCEQELQPVAEGRNNFVAECDTCGFFASTRDMVRADYLANVSQSLGIRITAERIASRSPLLNGHALAPAQR